MSNNNDNDFLYENAPLVEVIAEIYWNLVQIQSSPGSAIDPYFKDFQKSFQESIGELGYTYIEQLVPDNVPLEFLSGRATHRYRQAEGRWPLFQIGPGLLTVNIVPPYEGWSDFYQYIELGLKNLFDCYPTAEKYLNLNALDLRYIDAFTEEHGVQNRYEFLKNDLTLASDIGPRVQQLAVDSRESILQNSQVTINLKKPENTVANISSQNGISGNKPAVVVTFQSRNQNIADKEKSLDGAGNWFQESHEVLRELFQAMLSDRVINLLGEKRYVSE